jgi:hypothetical protein
VARVALAGSYCEGQSPTGPLIVGRNAAGPSRLLLRGKSKSVAIWVLWGGVIDPEVS